jgi:3'(2'), 5'-bisphosphate nucleotidase
MEETKIHLADVSSVSEASFCESFEPEYSSHDDSKQIALLLGLTKPPLRVDSQCNYCLVSRGDTDIYLCLRADHEENIWVYTII